MSWDYNKLNREELEMLFDEKSKELNVNLSNYEKNIKNTIKDIKYLTSTVTNNKSFCLHIK